MKKHTIKIRPDLQVTLNKGGTALLIERVVKPGIKTRMQLKTDEWQELKDWIQAVSFLSERDSIMKASLHKGYL